jgi:hypothetical protein
MKTKEEIEQQSNLIHTALILGGFYSNPDGQHKILLPCGIEILLQWEPDQHVGFTCSGYHRVQYSFANPRNLARRIQSYVWVICDEWDQTNYPLNK